MAAFTLIIDHVNFHCPSFSPTEMAALKLIIANAHARSHCSPFSQAEMAALKQIVAHARSH
eukprot:11686916-Karenia_brevis.AAC.1